MAASKHGGADDTRKADSPIADVMRTEFRSCNASTPILEAATALVQGGCPFLAVTQAQIPIGVVTEHALASVLARQADELGQLTASDLMTGEPPTVNMNAPIHEAASRLVEAGGYLLAVNSDGLLKGIVTFAELAPKLSDDDLRPLALRLAAARGLASPFQPASATRAIDPTAEIKSSKSQEQPHPWDSPTGAHPEPVPLVSPSDLINPLLKVSDAMTRNPRTCSSASTALEAVMIFRDAGCSAIPVTADMCPIGVVTDRDVALALASYEAELARTPVSDFMTRDIHTIRYDASLGAAIESLGEHGVPRLLVVDSEDRLVGMLSWRDLVPVLSDRGLGHAVSRIVAHH